VTSRREERLRAAPTGRGWDPPAGVRALVIWDNIGPVADYVRVLHMDRRMPIAPMALPIAIAANRPFSL